MQFEELWQRIVHCAGEEFRTITGVSFAYEIIDNYVVPKHTGYKLAKSQFEKAAALPELTGPGQINQLVRGPSYVFAILTDQRIR